MFSRCKKLMCQHPVICNKKQSFCILIQTSYRKQPFAVRWYIFHNCSVIAIFCGTDAAGRFVQKIIDKFRCRTNSFPRKHNHIILRIDFHLRFLRRYTVHLNLPFLYEFFHFTSGSLSRICEKLIQPYCLCHIYSLF